jgi:radical SAM superfamily enzyme YgiQ (UPF0313 family)
MAEHIHRQEGAPAPAGLLNADLRVWLADLTYTQQTIAADVMPNGIGGIATFTETRVTLPEPIRLFKYPERLASALDAAHAAGGLPQIVGFSNYIWNFDLTYHFAKRIKAVAPGTVVVFGGPNYPVVAAEQERFLRAFPAIDFYVIKEGELAFAQLVAALWESGFERTPIYGALPSVHAIGPDGRAHLTPTVARLTDLTQIPSPYATGRLDEFFDGMLLPIIQTNRGCPFGCTFCVEGVGYYNKVYRSSNEKVAAEVDYIGAKMAELRARGGRNDLFIADSNFGMYKDDLETCRQLARAQQMYNWPEYINVATGKNQKQRVLEATRLINGAMRLSGSVQTLDPVVLKNIQRDNISAEGLMDLALQASEIGANSYSEIILGLPGDSRETHYHTVRTIMDAGFTNIYLFQLMLLPGTDMCTDACKAEYEMVSRYRVLPRCYGHFDVLGERVVAAEVEEICVASRTLPFEHYLECRQMHLVVTIFHNDGVFGALLKFLRSLGVSVYRWMELMRDAVKPAGLAALFEAFDRATREELWDDRSALEAFVREPGNVDRFIAGELGNNLLFVHKTLAITQHAGELAALARSTVRALLAEAGQDAPSHLAFVDDALAYHLCRMSHLFHEMDSHVTARLRYDLPAYDETRSPEAIEEYELQTPATYHFVLDDSQRGLIARYVNIYGSSPVGLGRILSKVYVRKLFRHPARQADAVFEGESELQYRIAGLQN